MYVYASGLVRAQISAVVIYLVEYICSLLSSNIMYKSVAIQYNHHGVVCQLLQQYRACLVDSVLWYIGKPVYP